MHALHKENGWYQIVVGPGATGWIDQNVVATNDRRGTRVIRIQFPPGASRTTIQDQLASQAQSLYLFRAAAGQHATIRITSASESVLFPLEGVSDGRVYKHLLDGHASWTGVLLEDQDYRLTLDNAGPDVTAYTLELTIVAAE